MDELKTKAGITRDPIDEYTVHSSRITKYLAESILGVNGGIACQYTVLRGVDTSLGFVVMKVAISNEIIEKREMPTTAGEQLLYNSGVKKNVREDVIKALEPFKYNSNVVLMSDMRKQKLISLGLNSDSHWLEIDRYKNLVSMSPIPTYMIVLDIEQILREMFSDPDTNEQRKIGMINVQQADKDNIIMKIKLVRGNNITISPEMTFDQMFRSR